MNEQQVSKEYAKVLSEYLQKFGLESIDLSYLIGTKKDVIDGLLNSTNGVVLRTLEKIANVFGLRYFELGNPKNPIPTFDSLPEKTKKRIKYRASEGASQEKSYNQLDINDKIIVHLSRLKMGDNFLAEEITRKIKLDFEENLEVGIVNDRLSKTFRDFVKKTDRKELSKKGSGPKPSYYEIVKEIPEELRIKAERIVFRSKN